MDDLERAILLVYEPAGFAADAGLRSQATAYCRRLTAGPPSSLIRLCLDRLHRSPNIPVQFWCLQSLHDLVCLRYSDLSDDPDLPLLRSSLLSLFSDRTLPSSSPPFLKNKLSQILAALIRLEYPTIWSSPFLQLLSFLPAAGPAAVDMFCRLLVALDDDLISQDYHQSPNAAAAASRVKDGMRRQCVPQIARSWFDIVSLYRSTESALAVAALESMRRYIAWIDIGLVANDVFIPLLFDLVLSTATPEQLSAAAAGCLLAIVSKRMDPQSKLNLLRSIRVNQFFADPKLVPKISSLTTGYASEALECYKRLGSENSEGSYTAMELFEESLPSVFYVMQNCVELDSSNVVQFLSDYVSTMKSPSDKQMVFAGYILQIIQAQISYDPAYRKNLDIPDKIGMEEEEQMAERRKDLFTLFRTVCRVAPHVTQAFIRNLIANALATTVINVEEVEAALTFFCRFGETVSEEEMKSSNGFLGEIVPMLLSAKFACHSHRLVALVYLETVTKFMKFVLENGQYIPNVLAAFLDERGIHHPNLNVSRRASYLFMRAVKLLKARLVPFIDTILQSLQDIVVQYASLDWVSNDLKSCGSEDGCYAFEAIGLLIGMEDVAPEKQSEYLAALLKPLCQQIEAFLFDAKKLEEYSAKFMRLQQIIMAINALSKGFSERIVTVSRPAIGSMFKQTLDVLLQVLVAFPTFKPVRNKITSYIHRMVEILGTSVFPYLPMALDRLLVDSEPKDMLDFLVLINQVICKFGTSVESMLEEIFPIVASRLFGILTCDPSSSDSGCNTEERRELQELQRTLYTFLHVMVTCDLSSVFLAPNSHPYLDAIIQSLMLTSCNSKDVLMRKMCVQIFIKLIKDWCVKHNGEEKVPGFRSFIIEKFSTYCCLYSILDNIEFYDANTESPIC